MDFLLLGLLLPPAVLGALEDPWALPWALEAGVLGGFGGCSDRDISPRWRTTASLSWSSVSWERGRVDIPRVGGGSLPEIEKNRKVSFERTVC